MRLFIILILCLFLDFQGRSQNLVGNHCDSTILTQEEYEKCKIDSVFGNDIIVRSNYIIFLKTELFPRYRIHRKEIVLPNEVKRNIAVLKAIYDSIINVKLQRFSLDMDRNQKYVQPKAYIASILAFETFKLYPDVYALLLNEIHLSLNPKTDFNQMKQIQVLVGKIYSLLSNSLKEKTQQITSELTRERKAYTNNPFLDMFQSELNKEEKEKYNTINFLLWTE
jgi:hypothetical protein